MNDLILKNAPVGTLAKAIGGGRWYKTEQGWKWNGPDGTGGTFPRPGGDWIGTLVYPYPTGIVTGPCICGSWPGGECIQCEVTHG